MAKYRHRIFEMYDYLDEATVASRPRTEAASQDDLGQESWRLTHLTVSRAEGVVHVRFKEAEHFDDETLNDFREDFAQLAEQLPRDSKVVIDFTGVSSFGQASIEAISLFKQRLQTKGSRIALCCLDDDVRAGFFLQTQPDKRV
ncbi:MAG: STAS domain-containing protein [Pirellulaceae bacterium]